MLHHVTSTYHELHAVGLLDLSMNNKEIQPVAVPHEIDQ